MPTSYAPGSLVSARGREWVVLPESAEEMLVLRPLGGGDDDVAAVFPSLEDVAEASFAWPTPEDLGNEQAAGLLRSALRIGFRSGAGPFRSLAGIAVQPRAYQLVPLLMALRQPTVRMLISDDVGIGKTVEAGLIATELLAQGEARKLAVLCSPALAEQWQEELRTKFGIDAELVLSSTVSKLERGLDLGQSLFDKHRHVIVSTDFIKSTRHRDDFVRHCPDLVIVDEAHTCVTAGDTKAGRSTQNQLRYELLRKVAADAERHLMLVTATPHSGKEEAFRALLGLVNPELADVDLDTDEGRRLLARHFVQRKRADVRQYLTRTGDGLADDSLAETTSFPRDREFADETYRLSPEYKDLLGDAIAYARERVHRAGGKGDRDYRVAWWSAIALLRAMVSSPRAAAKTLTTRSAAAAAETAEEADALGAPVARDAVDTDTLEGMDTAHGADLAAEGERGATEDAPDGPLAALARRAAELEGPQKDHKLAALIKHLNGLLDAGYNPIVFCHYIDTAEYVAAHLGGEQDGGSAEKSTSGKGVAAKRKSLLDKGGANGRRTTVMAVTGKLSPQQRVERIEELAKQTAAEAADDAAKGPTPRRVLVATDCLSEGVNLQHYFDAVVHYDLAWNPTRHDQREGRVDRFGQLRDLVRVVTLYGEDNGIDGKVLEVLIRKHRQIRKDLGIAVSVPDEASSGVTDAIVEWLLMRGSESAEQESLFGSEELAALDRQAEAIETQWKSAAERERTSRSRFAQRAIHPEEVAREVAAVRDALGGAGEVRTFTERALRGLGGLLTPLPDGGEGFRADLSGTPIGLRDAVEPLAGTDATRPGRGVRFRDTAAVARGEAALVRTDPVLGALAAHVLDTALDTAPDGRPSDDRRPARRCGVIRTDAVDEATTLLLVRYRFHLTLPSRHGTRQMVAEDARLLAFTGTPDHPEWLEPEQATALLEVSATQNTALAMAKPTMRMVLDDLPSAESHLDAHGETLATELADAHRRVRIASDEIRRGLRVQAQKPADILGVYVYLPVAPTVAGGAA
ncbi:DEAD/DEAH box helicase [Spiractinospora alimapuensis]|uniref:DEAD/DEAH box helicase n=1 Tax=Spiractinospora alimapuensis TaxID=2820884 RepID=UPI001F30846C|nr:DEAD/DEAH box helicase [Spiractinospora alimapuensis]QVQ53165.1 DEAD/DEAH box helicase [Spiractinospora alimapuensis]